MSSDEEVLCVRKKKVVIGDSSDENEIIDKKDIKLEEEESCHEIPDSGSENRKKNKKKQRRLKTFDSSSESDSDSKSTLDSKSSRNKFIKTSQKKNKEKHYSHEENNDFVSSNSESSNENEEPVSEEMDTNQKPSSLGSKQAKEKSSSEEDDVLSDSPDSPKETQQNKKKERKSKKKAQEDIKKDIHRESQRLIRQVPISIPYHRPKQRSLAEFLVRRRATTKVPLRTSSEQLVIALREIEQREKEAELFYKSESSEDDSEVKTEDKNSQNNFDDKCKQFFDKNSHENSDTSNIKQIDLNIRTGSLERCDVKMEDVKNTKNPVNEDGYPGEHSHKNRIIIGENSNGNIEETEVIGKQRILSDETKVVSTNPIKEVENVCNESAITVLPMESEMAVNEEGNVHTCKGPTFESLPMSLKENLGILDSNNRGLNANQSDSDKHLKNNIDSLDLKDNVLSDCELNKSIQSIDVSSNSVNVDEFSLKLSESQSGYESTEKGSFQISSDDSLKEINTETPEDSSTVNTEEFSLKLSESQSELESSEKGLCQSLLYHNNINTITDSNIEKKSSNIVQNNDLMDQGDKTDGISQRSNKMDSESENPETVKQSCKEREVEKELYKKYNVDLITTVSAPKITGTHDKVIDLDEGISKPEVHQLMKRFLTHLSYKKKPSKKKTSVELSIVSAEKDGEGHVSAINEEVVQVHVGEEEEEDPQLSRPGAKLARLRAQLQQQMERQRDQEWTKKLQEQRLYEDEEVFEGEKDVCGGYEDGSKEAGDDENKDETEEEEDEDVEEEESEEDETDEEIAEKKRKTRNVFLDDEAEESDEEIYTKKNYKSIKENQDDKDSQYDVDDGDYNGTNEDTDYINQENCTEQSEKTSDRSPVKGGNSKGSCDISDFFIKRPAKMKPVLPRTLTATDMFSPEELLKYSTDEEELPSFQKPRPLDEKEDLDEKLSEPPSIISPAFQLSALENMDGIKKYNWSEPSTPCKDLPSPRIITPVRAIPNLMDKSPQVCTQELENMCSGRFSSQPLEETEEAPQDFELFFAEDSQLMEDLVTPEKSSSTRKSNSDGKEQLTALLIDDEEELAGKVSCKKAKKLQFSDDEDDDNNEQKSEREAESEGNEDDEYDVAYDSEENEVEVAKTAGEFLDVEAELSEEEWSSEDEDERGLDTLEMEEADREKIDQRRLKQQLGQIHMKEMLKEDKMQVKLLQEMLLEDGELHSENKRQRLFRWSNNAAFGEGDNKAVLDSDEEKAEEDEDEENWRKSRHEREIFLQEQIKKTEKLESLELEDSDSQLLRLGQKALKRLSSQESRLTPPTLSNPLTSPDAKKPFTLPKRGSFLCRGQQALSRLAQIVSSTSDGPIQQPKNSRNFVFTSISPTKCDQNEPKPALVLNKRKMPHLPLPIAKKPCVQKPKTANKKSLFEALTKVQS